MDIDQLILEAPRSASVLDIGCFGFLQVGRAAKLGRSDLKHAGVDSRGYDNVPPQFDFRQQNVDGHALPFETDRFDIVIASQVMEHLHSPVEFFGECARVCKPGGSIYLEVPSERAMWLPGFPVEHQKFFSLSFFDDPTHVGRPWTPQALYRLAACYGLEILEARHVTSRKALLRFPFVLAQVWLTKKNGEKLERTAWLAFGWVARLVARKPVKGAPSFTYFIPERP